MHKTFLYSALLVAGIGVGGCKSSKHSAPKRLPGVWQATPITIDGDNHDWPAPYPEYDSKASLGYAVSNDRENLYVTVETGDQATQMKILRNGLTLWIDKTGEKEEVTAINFPLPRHFNRNVSNDKSDEDRPSPGHWVQGPGDAVRQRANLEDRIKKQMAEANEYSLRGFRGCNGQYPILQKDTCGVIVRMALDETNELVWEAVIPFKSFYYKAQIEKKDKGKALSICFETTGAGRPAGQGGAGGRGGGMRPGIGIGGGGMGMRMGGGMGGYGGRGGGYGGGGGAQNNAMENLYKSTTTWKKFGIAWQDTPNP